MLLINLESEWKTCDPSSKSCLTVDSWMDMGGGPADAAQYQCFGEIAAVLEAHPSDPHPYCYLVLSNYLVTWVLYGDRVALDGKRVFRFAVCSTRTDFLVTPQVLEEGAGVVCPGPAAGAGGSEGQEHKEAEGEEPTMVGLTQATPRDKVKNLVTRKNVEELAATIRHVAELAKAGPLEVLETPTWTSGRDGDSPQSVTHLFSERQGTVPLPTFPLAELTEETLRIHDRLM